MLISADLLICLTADFRILFFLFQLKSFVYEKIQSPAPMKFSEGLSSTKDLKNDGKTRLMIIDDLMSTVADAEMCTK